MSDEILINVTLPETRVALVENGVLQEVRIERAQRRGLVGNVYKGRVCRVLPGMQAAFVDIGLERAAFLHESDLATAEQARDAPLAQVCREGQEIVVQVIKDSLGSKGARLTMEISLPSRYVVLMPGVAVAGVSQRIECEDERARLKAVIESFRQMDAGRGGYIARTAAEGVDEFALRADMLFLEKLWDAVAQRIPAALPGALLYEEPPLSVRAVRDLWRPHVEKVRVDSREVHLNLAQFVAEFMPELTARVEHYAGERPLFDLYGVEDEIRRALERKVPLKSGGHLVFDQTEAMTTVDVNTGGYVGGRNLEETIFKTNLEAAQVIAWQLRLRNLGGIVIVDFIDMHDEEHKAQVLEALRKGLEKDHARTAVSEVSALGLVQMTRKRTRESLEHILCEACPCCSGRGMIKTAETVGLEIQREIVREVRQYSVQELMVLASPEVVERLREEDADQISELEAFLGVRIRFRAESPYGREQFDIVLL